MKKQPREPCNFTRQDQQLLQALQESRSPVSGPPQPLHRVASYSALQSGRHIPIVPESQVRWPFQLHRGVDPDLLQVLQESRIEPASPRALRSPRSTPILVARAEAESPPPPPPVLALSVTTPAVPTITLSRPGKAATPYPVPRGVPKNTSDITEVSIAVPSEAPSHGRTPASQAVRTKRSKIKVNSWLSKTPDDPDVAEAARDNAARQPLSPAADPYADAGGAASADGYADAVPIVGNKRSRKIWARAWRWMFL